MAVVWRVGEGKDEVEGQGRRMGEEKAVIHRSEEEERYAFFFSLLFFSLQFWFILDLLLEAG